MSIDRLFVSGIHYDLTVFSRNYYKNIIFFAKLLWIHYPICEFTINSLPHVLAKLNGIFKIGQFKEHQKEVEKRSNDEIARSQPTCIHLTMEY